MRSPHNPHNPHGRPLPDSEANLRAFERHPVMCGVCKEPINTFANPEGTLEWVHARHWLRHDHDAKAVRAALSDVASICDFCAADHPTWQVYGAHVRTNRSAFDDGAVHDYGTRWSACVNCLPFVIKHDVEGLARHVEVQPSSRISQEPDPHIRAAMQRALRDMLAAFVPTVYKRERIPAPPPPPAKLTPARLVKVRDRLVRYYRSHDAATVFADLDDPAGFNLPGQDWQPGTPHWSVNVPRVGPAAAERYTDRIATSLASSSLWWISHEFTLMAAANGQKLPTLTVQPEDLPSPHGLIVFQTPVLEIPMANALDAPVVALSWHRLDDGVWLNLYYQPETIFPGTREQVRELIGFLLPASTGAGVRFDHEVLNMAEEDSMVRRVWGTLLATWFLIDQPGVAQITTAQPEKDIRRSYARASRPLPDVRIVNIRTRGRRRADAATGTTGRAWGVRVVVGQETGGFWRNQSYGPKHGLRKMRWIFPYVAGPDDAPLKGSTETVHVLK